MLLFKTASHSYAFSFWSFLSPSGPSSLHFSLKRLVVLLLTHAAAAAAAALSAGLWLGIPAVVTNPRFLVANGL